MELPEIGPALCPQERADRWCTSPVKATIAGRGAGAPSGRSALLIFLPRVVMSLTPVLCRACWSLLHPWVVRRVGVHRRATVIAGFGAKFVVPGFVAVDLA
jgi:hypothetical protein